MKTTVCLSSSLWIAVYFIIAMCSPTLAQTVPSICLLDGRGAHASSMLSCASVPSVCGDQTSNAASGAYGLRINPGIASTPIDVHGLCRYIDNLSGNGYFIPFKTSLEWSAFLNTNVAGINKTHCARPFSGMDVSHSLYFGPTSALFSMGDTGDAITAGVSLPYWRTGQSWPPSTTTCSNTTHTFNNTCYEDFLQYKCWKWVSRTCKTKTGTSYDCSYCGDEGSTCGKRTHSWSELFGFKATALDSDTNTPSWTGFSARLTSDSRPAQCNVRCKFDGHDCNCTGDSGSTTPTVPVPTPTPVNGVCGSTVNGQSLSTAPSGAELCNTGTPSAVNGTGPWTWSCQGANGGTTDTTCQAKQINTMCPVASMTGTLFNNNLHIGYAGILPLTYVKPTSFYTYVIPAEEEDDSKLKSPFASQTKKAGYIGHTFSYFNGVCYGTYGAGGKGTWSVYGKVGAGTHSQLEDAIFPCIATEYAHKYLPDYAKCTPSTWGGSAICPVKVSLSKSDAANNGSSQTAFYLTLQNGSIFGARVNGGLNPGEGWLMVRRNAEPLVLRNGALNANHWFGDRDHRSLNGYTDLAETFGSFLVKENDGKRFIPLHTLTEAEKKAKTADAEKSGYGVSDPSFDLRVVDAKNVEHFASDYFDRIYVDYRNTVEGDKADIKNSKNLVLERSMVRTIDGQNHGSVDQWFVLDVSNDYKPMTPKSLPSTAPTTNGDAGKQE